MEWGALCMIPGQNVLYHLICWSGVQVFGPPYMKSQFSGAIYLFLNFKRIIFMHCRTTWSCRYRALPSNSGLDSIGKDSWSTRRVDCCRQLHTVGFGMARAWGPLASLCAECPKAKGIWEITRICHLSNWLRSKDESSYINQMEKN